MQEVVAVAVAVEEAVVLVVVEEAVVSGVVQKVVVVHAGPVALVDQKAVLMVADQGFPVVQGIYYLPKIFS